jgi:hypothetical protein
MWPALSEVRMTDYTIETLQLYSGRSPRRPVDPDWHRHWFMQCAGDGEADVFRRLGQRFPFAQIDVGEATPHDFPPNSWIGPGNVR